MDFTDGVSLFTIGPDGPRLADRVASEGVAPTSVSIAGTLVYVLNNGSASISGFNLDSDRLVPLRGSRRVLSSIDADPAQIAFSPDGHVLAVTERGTDSISTFTLDQSGNAQGPATIPSSGATPYGFDFTAGGAMIVTETFGGA